MGTQYLVLPTKKRPILLEELRQALAQQEQRPVGTYEGVMEAMLSLRSGTLEQQQIYGHMKDKLLYTAPPKQWVWLTAEEILDSADAFGSFQYGDAQGYKRLEFARAIEAKLKEKNNG